MEKFLTLLSARVSSGSVTVAELAKAGGVSRTHIYAILHGKPDGSHPVPSFSLVEKLAGAIGAEVKISGGKLSTKSRKNCKL